MHARNWNRILMGLTMTVPIPYVAYAEVYLNEIQAAEVLFPNLQLQSAWIELTPAEIQMIEKASGKKCTSTRIRVWWGPNKEALIIDHVIGKHERIKYAVAVNSDGKIKGVEIMEYRETYGYQIREPQWREQFIGKDANDHVKLEKNITNISGATLSCAHITDGVRRILETYEIIKSKV